jgi:hypothetical protein
MTTVLFFAAVAFVLGTAQIYAGAGGVEPVCVRIGQVLLAVAAVLCGVTLVAGCS